MTDATLLANVRKALADEWKLLLPFIRDTPAFAHRRDRHEAALMALNELEKRHGQPATATEQITLQSVEDAFKRAYDAGVARVIGE